MSDRKAELERKKAKLQMMREEKKRKEEEKRKTKETDDGKISGMGGSLDLRTEAEQMLKDLGIPDAVETKRLSPSHSFPAPGRPDELPMETVTFNAGKSRVQLGMSKTTQTNIAPKELVQYTKETQTPAENLAPVLAYDTRDLDDDNDSMEGSPPKGRGGKKEEPEAETKQVEEEKKEEKPVVRDLSEEEKKQIMMSEEFHSFFDRTTRILERALTEEVTDIFMDYTGRDADDLEGDLLAGEKLKSNRVFYDERWSKFRSVTSFDWSTQYPELLLATYNGNEESPHEPDGVAMVWNSKYKKTTPEYVFHCQSALMSGCFAKFHPNLVVGGTYSGQIVLWDNRSNKRTPIQRTPLSAAAHTHPVYCVNVVGTQNAHNLISVSTDGKLCSWSLDMLSTPQESIELQSKQSKSVAVTSFSFLSGDVNNFVVGSEEGSVYTACRHGSKAGIIDTYEAHQGPVTGIDCHNVQGPIDFSQLFLTSSIDWTVKLWSMKEQKPLHSFEDNSDYIYDVSWSPIHPALFCTVDGMGRVDLWNINTDTEVPSASVQVEGGVALNRCRWHASGHQIAVGDDMGKIHVYDVNENLASPRPDEWNRLVHTIQEINQNRAENEDATITASPLR